MKLKDLFDALLEGQRISHCYFHPHEYIWYDKSQKLLMTSNQHISGLTFNDFSQSPHLFQLWMGDHVKFSDLEFGCKFKYQESTYTKLISKGMGHNSLLQLGERGYYGGREIIKEYNCRRNNNELAYVFPDELVKKLED
jgi:hypothetical protein